MCDASAVAVSGVATAAKTNVALVSAVGFFSSITFTALLSNLHYDLILLVSAPSASMAGSRSRVKIRLRYPRALQYYTCV